MSRLIQLFTAVCVLTAFLWDNAGGSCMEGLHQWHRNQQQKRLHAIAADTLIVPYAEYLSLTSRDKEEIDYHGRMYDIFNATRYGSSVLLTGHFDNFDNELFKVLSSLFGDDPDTLPGMQGQQIFTFIGILPELLVLPDVQCCAADAAHIVSNVDMLGIPMNDVLLVPPEANAT